MSLIALPIFNSIPLYCKCLAETVTNETAATKIIELSRKVRELTAEKESERTKCRQLQKKILDLQQVSSS